MLPLFVLIGVLGLRPRTNIAMLLVYVAAMAAVPAWLDWDAWWVGVVTRAPLLSLLDRPRARLVCIALGAVLLALAIGLAAGLVGEPDVDAR